jgi:tetratricopeptide (TPR) repeat protein
MWVNCYEEALSLYRVLAAENPRTYSSDVATTLNNLANLHSDKNEFDKALNCYEEALSIRRALAAENPNAYFIDLSSTLINLSIFYLQSVPHKENSVDLAKEALIILLPRYETTTYLASYIEQTIKVLQANGVDVESLFNGEE